MVVVRRQLEVVLGGLLRSVRVVVSLQLSKSGDDLVTILVELGDLSQVCLAELGRVGLDHHLVCLSLEV